MKKLLSLCFALAASHAHADICTGENLTPLPEMESIKDAFFRGDYRDFASQLGPNFPNIEERARDMFRPLAEAIPGEFASCNTVLQRHESPGFYQDLVIYYDDEIEGPIALLLVGADFDGEFRFLEFTFNSSVTAVLDQLR